jgi:hypothetical protein
VAIRLSQQKFRGSVCGSVVDNEKPPHPDATVMREVLPQAQHLIAHSHECTDLVAIAADRPIINTQQCMHSCAFSRQICDPVWLHGAI